MRGSDFETLDCYVTDTIGSAEMVCVALAIIHAGKLYKETHRSFEAYMEESLGRSGRSGYRWVTFGKAILDAESAERAKSLTRASDFQAGQETPERKAERPKSQRAAARDKAKATAAVDARSWETTPAPATAVPPPPPDPEPSFKSLLAVLAKMDAATEALTVTEDEYKDFMKWVRTLQAARHPAQAATAGAPPPAVVRDAAHQDQVRTYFKKKAAK